MARKRGSTSCWRGRQPPIAVLGRERAQQLAVAVHHQWRIARSLAERRRSQPLHRFRQRQSRPAFTARIVVKQQQRTNTWKRRGPAMRSPASVWHGRAHVSITIIVVVACVRIALGPVHVLHAGARMHVGARRHGADHIGELGGRSVKAATKRSSRNSVWVAAGRIVQPRQAAACCPRHQRRIFDLETRRQAIDQQEVAGLVAAVAADGQYHDQARVLLDVGRIDRLRRRACSRCARATGRWTEAGSAAPAASRTPR